MKSNLSLFSATRTTLLLAGAVTLLVTATVQAQTGLLLNFTETGGPSVIGWNTVFGNMLADTTPAGIININGLGYDFSINHVGCYDNGVATEPLTRSGFYTFGNNANDHTFTLSGLAAGATVSLYACAAWDGNGRGGVVVFGDSGAGGIQAQTLGDPGAGPTLANFTRIGAAVVDNTGSLQGTLNGSGGVGSATEGQVGGFIFEITSVPEPETLALVGLGLAGFATLRRKNRS
jgi:hypothetical protein